MSQQAIIKVHPSVMRDVPTIIGLVVETTINPANKLITMTNGWGVSVNVRYFDLRNSVPSYAYQAIGEILRNLE